LVFITIMLMIMVLLPGTQASPNDHHPQSERQRADLRIREVSNKVKAFAQDFSNDLAEKANNQGENGEALALNLVAAVISSVCHQHFNGAHPADFAPEVAQNCVKSVYNAGKPQLSAGQFFAVFGASLLCDYVVSEAYPVVKEFLPCRCERLQELTKEVPPT
jgi:hypothetical protein